MDDPARGTCRDATVTNLKALDDYSEWMKNAYALRTEREYVIALYDARREAGVAYDRAFRKWLNEHNDALASCTYAKNYLNYHELMYTSFIEKLMKEKADIEKHCDQIPAMSDFEVNNAHITETNIETNDDGGHRRRRSLLEMTEEPCEAIIEAINGMSSHTSAETAGRANCLEYYCESSSEHKEPAARGVADDAAKAGNGGPHISLSLNWRHRFKPASHHQIAFDRLKRVFYLSQSLDSSEYA